MQRTMIETLMGAVVLACAGLFLVLAYTTTDVGSGNGYELSARFSQVGDVKVGSPVKVGGIGVGTVTGLELDRTDFSPVINMIIDEEYRLPRDTAAVIASDGLLGGHHVELVPGGDEVNLEAGDEIEFTQDPVDFVQMLGQYIFSPGGSGGSPDAK